MRPFVAGVASGAVALAGAVRLLERRRAQQAEVLSDARAWWRAKDSVLKRGQADVIFLGTGSSTGVPTPACLLPLCASTEEPSEHLGAQVTPPRRVNADGRTVHCPVCASARETMSSPTTIPSSYRGNPSMLIRFEDQEGVRRHVVIDCGKTFRDSVLRWFPYYGVPGVDAVVLTHDHADAILGLDDIRSVQRTLPGQTLQSGKPVELQTTQVFLNRETMATVDRVFPYLTRPLGGGKVARYVAKIAWNVVEPYTEFSAAGLRMTPLPVVHGEDYHYMLAFEFGAQPHRFIYMSDVSRIPDKTMEALKAGGQIETMVLDCLFLDRQHSTHVNFHGAMEILAELRPRRALLVGMAHDFDHRNFQATIEARRDADPRLAGTDIRLASDGLRLPLEL
mmetsp:Transcript_69600/g.215167  ORF Transcript_69600/g.215167 Transcript_69600/m.215167 type:complete len:394 (-) Transcript_69600:85-1266(-)